jgi:hypothetical protein
VSGEWRVGLGSIKWVGGLAAWWSVRCFCLFFLISNSFRVTVGLVDPVLWGTNMGSGQPEFKSACA